MSTISVEKKVVGRRKLIDRTGQDRTGLDKTEFEKEAQKWTGCEIRASEFELLICETEMITEVLFHQNE